MGFLVILLQFIAMHNRRFSLLSDIPYKDIFSPAFFIRKWTYQIENEVILLFTEYIFHQNILSEIDKVYSYVTTKITGLCVWIVLINEFPAVNTSRPRQNDRYFTKDILKCVSLNENVWIPITI